MDSAATLRDTLIEQLRQRAFGPGERMPTERALGERFGLSRSTVRRALQDLKRLRLITQTVGSGTYVAGNADEVLSEMRRRQTAQATSPAELMAARLVLEPAVVEMVIGNATAADFDRMDECIRRAETAATLQDFEQWDAALHAAIADAAHNRFIADVFELMNQVRAQGEWGMLKQRSATAERRREYQQEHRALVAALKERDVVRARALYVAHLIHVRTNMLGP